MIIAEILLKVALAKEIKSNPWKTMLRQHRYIKALSCGYNCYNNVNSTLFAILKCPKVSFIFL
jgi:hypothetical protein